MPPTLSQFLGSTLTNNRSPVIISSSVTVGTLQFSNTLNYTLSASPGQSLTLAGSSGAAPMQDMAGSHQISAPVILGSNTAVTVTSSGDSLTLSGNISPRVRKP